MQNRHFFLQKFWSCFWSDLALPGVDSACFFKKMAATKKSAKIGVFFDHKNREITLFRVICRRAFFLQFGKLQKFAKIWRFSGYQTSGRHENCVFLRFFRQNSGHFGNFENFHFFQKMGFPVAGWKTPKFPKMSEKLTFFYVFEWYRTSRRNWRSGKKWCFSVFFCMKHAYPVSPRNSQKT